MRFLLSSLFSLVFLFVCCASVAPASNHFFTGRSANIQFQPNQPADLFCVLNDPSGHYFRPSSSIAKDMSIVNVFDGAATAMSLSPLNQDRQTAFNTEFVHAQLTDRPRANVFTAVGGVGKHSVKISVMPHLFQMIHGAATSSVTTDTASASSTATTLPFTFKDAEPSVMSPPLSTAASIATASPVSAHGIVNHVWKGKHGAVSAYSDDSSSWAHRATFADILTQAFSGKSMTVSFSSQPQLAAAFGVNYVLQQDKPSWNNFVISLDKTADAFTAIAPSSSSSLSSSAHLHRSLASLKADIFSSSSFLHQLSVSNSLFTYELDSAKSQVKIIVNGKSETVFDLNESEDLLFLAELQYIHLLPELLHSSQHLSDLVTDSYPDALAINIAATNQLAMRYGADSEKYQAALMLLDAALPSLQHRLYGLYPQRAVGQLVALGSAAQVELDNEAAFAATLKPFGQFDPQYFPLFYTPTGQSADVCARLSAAVHTFGLSATCMEQPQAQQTQQAADAGFVNAYSKVHAAVPNDANANLTALFLPTYYPSETQIEKFQIVLWVSVLLAFVLAGVIYASAYMSFKKDTMLYSTFNPRWEDKKHR